MGERRKRIVAERGEAESKVRKKKTRLAHYIFAFASNFYKLVCEMLMSSAFFFSKTKICRAGKNQNSILQG